MLNILPPPFVNAKSKSVVAPTGISAEDRWELVSVWVQRFCLMRGSSVADRLRLGDCWRQLAVAGGGWRWVLVRMALCAKHTLIWVVRDYPR